MNANPDYKIKSGSLLSSFRSRSIDANKIQDHLQQFDQTFNDRPLTRGNLEQFCNDHGITVPEPPDKILKKAKHHPANYGSVSLLELSNKALRRINAENKESSAE